MLSKCMTFHGNIIFPEGAGGNHLRWLLFLDPQYPDPFNNYVTPEDKANFIINEVYHDSRTWNTWLQREWHFRPMLDGPVNISHDFQSWSNLIHQRTLYVIFKDYELPITHYSHINLSLNSTTPEQFRNKFQYRHSIMLEIQNQNNPNFTFAYGDTIFDPQLDLNFYQQLVDCFKFGNYYEQAARVHRAYTECRNRSAKDFIEYFNSDEFKKFQQVLLKITR
jgi:hypothetical protein